MTARTADVVIGAGPAGLAVGAMLRRRGRDPLLLERAGRVGESWQSRYDCLHLNTARWWSRLPGLEIPRRFGTWVSAKDYARYLELYARHHELDVRLGVGVEGISPHESGWLVESSVGEFEADNVIVATGYDREPSIPSWPGADGFTGQLLHASAYRNPRPFAGRSVLVVGSGNSAADIAVDLVRGGASKVWNSIRTPPQIVPRTVGGIPMQTVAIVTRSLPVWVGDAVVRSVQILVHGDLSPYGLPSPREGVSAQFRRADVVPVIDVAFVHTLKRGEVEFVAAVSAFDGERVLLADGSSLQPDVVVAATGYRRGLERLVGNLGVLGERGRPITSGAESPDGLSGLYFAGYTNPLSGNLRELGIHARQIADQIATSPRSAQQRARPTADLDPHSAPHNESESRFLNSTQGSVNRKASQSKAAR